MIKNKKIKLVELDVIGTCDQLLQIELLMVLFGYVSDESWNWHTFSNDNVLENDLFCLSFYVSNPYSYYSEDNRNAGATAFNATNIKRIISYIETHQK